MLVEPQVIPGVLPWWLKCNSSPAYRTDHLRVNPSRSSGLTRKTCSKSVAASRGRCAPQFLIFVTEVCAWQFTTKLE